jgi:hypothetical protein
MDGAAYVGSPFSGFSPWQPVLGDGFRETSKVGSASECNVCCRAKVMMKQEGKGSDDVGGSDMRFAWSCPYNMLSKYKRPQRNLSVWTRFDGIVCGLTILNTFLFRTRRCLLSDCLVLQTDKMKIMNKTTVTIGTKWRRHVYTIIIN